MPLVVRVDGQVTSPTLPVTPSVNSFEHKQFLVGKSESKAIEYFFGMGFQENLISYLHGRKLLIVHTFGSHS